MTNTFQVGREIEAAAADLLRHRNRKLIQQNYRTKSAEVDLIFEERVSHFETQLVFVEVRGRAASSLARAVESVDTKKQSKIRKAAEFFLNSYRGPATSIRFDIMGWNGDHWEYVPDAF